MALTIQTRIIRFQKKIDKLLEKYESFESLKEACRTYSGGDPDPRKDLKQIQRWLRQIMVLQQQSENSHRRVESNTVNENLTTFCHNCHRVQQPEDRVNDGVFSHTHLDLQQRSSDTLPKRSRKFKFVVASTRNIRLYTLCHQCNCHLQER